MSLIKVTRLKDLTGTSNPLVSTPEETDVSEKIANTEFVHRALENMTFIGNYFTELPVLSGPTSGNKNSSVTVTITNYNATNEYTIAVTAGTFVDNADGTITWSLPDVSGDTTHHITVYATAPGLLKSDNATLPITVLWIPTVNPVLSGPSSANEGVTISIIISNYDAEASAYNITVTGGTFSRSADVISWTMPDVTVDTSYRMGVSVTIPEGSSAVVNKDVLCVNVPIEADDSIVVTFYEPIEDSNTGFSHF